MGYLTHRFNHYVPESQFTVFSPNKYYTFSGASAFKLQVKYQHVLLASVGINGAFVGDRLGIFEDSNVLIDRPHTLNKF